MKMIGQKSESLKRNCRINALARKNIDLVSMEEFKAIHEITEPDERNRFFVTQDPEGGCSRPLELNDVYDDVAAITLESFVPEDVISQFNVARNLCVYSWYSYSFYQIAEGKSFATIEQALKIKLDAKKGGLSNLLQKAVAKGLIKDRGFSHVVTSDDDPTKYSRALAKTLPKLRNELAHGSRTLHPGSISSLRIAADLINQLFDSADSKDVNESQF